MNKFFVAFVIASSFALVNCKNEKETVKNTDTTDSIKVDSVIADQHNAQNSLDYEGTYEGVLPCIKNDCKEIELSLKLMKNGIFVYSTKRVGIDKEQLMTSGTYHFEADGNTIVLDQIADVPNSFFISEGKIYQLDKDQKKIEGPDEEKYVLIKK